MLLTLPGFLPVGDTLIDILAEPNVSLHVPRVKEDFEVGWELDLEDLHIRSAIPMRRSMSTNIGESQTSQNTCTLVIVVILVQKETRRNEINLGQIPDSTIFSTFNWTTELV